MPPCAYPCRVASCHLGSRTYVVPPGKSHRGTRTPTSLQGEEGPHLLKPTDSGGGSSLIRAGLTKYRNQRMYLYACEVRQNGWATTPWWRPRRRCCIRAGRSGRKSHPMRFSPYLRVTYYSRGRRPWVMRCCAVPPQPTTWERDS